MRANRTASGGMTILELLVVIAVMGIFMGIAIPSVMKSFTAMERAKKTAAQYPDARRALGAVSDTLRRTYPATDAGAQFVGRNNSYEAGGVRFPLDEIRFAVMDDRFAAIGSVQNIMYSLQLPPAPPDSRGLMQTRSPLEGPVDSGIRESLLSDAIAFDARYLDDSQDPPEWVQEWPPQRGAVGSVLSHLGLTQEADLLPAAVEITVYTLKAGSSQPMPFRTVVNLPSARN